jgi:hypothetical protein
VLHALRPKLTFANVMVVLLTFIVLGGGAYAASRLPKNSVGTKQLKNGAVTQKKISKAAQKALRGKLGPTGPTGPQGPRGDAATLGGTIPAGVTLRGAAVASLVSPTIGNSFTGNGISFGGAQLAARPVAHIIPPGSPSSAACPGTVEAPEAASGNLCVYVALTVPAGEGTVIVIDPTRIALFGVNYNLKTAKDMTFEDGTVARFGFMFAYSQATTSSAQLQGSWAVTG